jgi:hypothetical protein
LRGFRFSRERRTEGWNRRAKGIRKTVGTGKERLGYIDGKAAKDRLRVFTSVDGLGDSSFLLGLEL